MSIPNDENALTEEEREALLILVGEIQIDIASGVPTNPVQFYLLRAAEHIEVLDRRIANFSREYRRRENAIEELIREAQEKAWEVGFDARGHDNARADTPNPYAS